MVNKNAIINAIRVLGECYPREITNFIDTGQLDKSVAGLVSKIKMRSNIVLNMKG